jgi:putative FmdB family regulatory protein
MPIYEYVCRECRHEFETLVTGSRVPSCPACQSQGLDKRHSVFAVSARSREAAPSSPGPCGSCGDPRGAGSCRVN